MKRYCIASLYIPTAGYDARRKAARAQARLRTQHRDSCYEPDILVTRRRACISGTRCWVVSVHARHLPIGGAV